MTVMYVTITPHDPVISRDARPFGEGARMKSLPWPYPSVLAGSVRTMIGKETPDGFTPAIVQTLKEVTIAGPFPCLKVEINGEIKEQLFLPAPKDILKEEKSDGTVQYHAIRPSKLHESEGCTFPCPGIVPAMISESEGEEFKPADIPPF